MVLKQTPPWAGTIKLQATAVTNGRGSALFTPFAMYAPGNPANCAQQRRGGGLQVPALAVAGILTAIRPEVEGLHSQLQQQ